MKKYAVSFAMLSLFLIIFSSCSNNEDVTDPNQNTGVSFQSFVSVGNSLTAGYQSQALYQSAQEYSFGKQLSKVFGNVKFEQPLISDPGLGARIEVKSLSPFAVKVNTAQGAPINLSYAAPYNNLGVPGAYLWDILHAKSSSTCFTARFGQPNQMFDVILRGMGTQFQQTKAQKPTFITLWIGNNDVLGYATSGGLAPITPADSFAVYYKQLADSVASLNAKVVVANIPSVTSIPFFNTVPVKLKDTSSGADITLYGQTTGGVRALVVGQDLLTLSASYELLDASGNPTGKGLSPENPLSNGVVLDKDEIANVNAAVQAFNQTIASNASAKGFGLVDINAVFSSIAQNGLVQDGLTLTTAFFSGGLFSLDGVHPTNIGYGVVANEFIKVINQKFSANLSLINLSTLQPGIIYANRINYGEYGIPILQTGKLDKVVF